VLFLVDRGNLGRQALKEFQAYTTPDDGRKFTELYNVTNLTHNKVDPVNKVVITTIQRLYSILKGEETSTTSWTRARPSLATARRCCASRPAWSTTPRFRPSSSTWWSWTSATAPSTRSGARCSSTSTPRSSGLTATPAKHTYAFFNKNVVSEYRTSTPSATRSTCPSQVYEIRTA
jgi:type I restriction enzyme R subunit